MLDAPMGVWPENLREREVNETQEYVPNTTQRPVLSVGGSGTSHGVARRLWRQQQRQYQPCNDIDNHGNASSATTPTTITDTPTASIATPTPTPQPKPAKGSTQVVLILNDSNGAFVFSPASLTITPGTTVIWKNMSSAPHTITSDDGQTFDSGTIAPGGTYKFKFTSPGAFPYHCNYHPYMKATINL